MFIPLFGAMIDLIILISQFRKTIKIKLVLLRIKNLWGRTIDGAFFASVLSVMPIIYIIVQAAVLNSIIFCILHL